MSKISTDRYLAAVDKYLSDSDREAQEMQKAGDNPPMAITGNPPQPGSTSASAHSAQSSRARRFAFAREYAETHADEIEANVPLKETRWWKENAVGVLPDDGDGSQTAEPAVDCNDKWATATNTYLEKKTAKPGDDPGEKEVQIGDDREEIDELIAQLMVQCPEFAKAMKGANTYADVLTALESLKSSKASTNPDREAAIASIKALPAGQNPTLQQLITAYGRPTRFGQLPDDVPVMGQILGVDYSSEKSPSEDVDQSLIKSISENLERTEG